jgi:septal ring factor EnvC (AmiA/AmiB activator)
MQEAQKVFQDLQKFKTENQKLQNQITNMYKENVDLKKNISDL